MKIRIALREMNMGHANNLLNWQQSFCSFKIDRASLLTIDEREFEIGHLEIRVMRGENS